ncbi:LysE family translocator [Histidinibacterium aquaticum]|uniref:LysE family translocator n=1 Tax=Histidinibacterium aquaticum TaxID=2613962 RepID=A0A5J5GB01_9RHOB|nr:LysE family translocator [Histidinibacterium aquaticum]KAA9005208.1 LysE family translocator [Histidinibacterium aquaticum]
MIADLPNLLLARGIQATGVLSPGPAVALILGLATTEGRGPALRTCLGIATGSLLLAVLTVVGLAALLAELRHVMIAVKILGAAYLAWLALGAFRKAASSEEPPVPAATAMSAGRRYAAGFVFQACNPKAIVFWLAIATVGGLQTVSAASLALFLCGVFVISFTGHGGWAVLLSSAPVRRLYARARRGIEAGLGLVFAAASLRILTSRI